MTSLLCDATTLWPNRFRNGSMIFGGHRSKTNGHRRAPTDVQNTDKTVKISRPAFTSCGARSASGSSSSAGSCDNSAGSSAACIGSERRMVPSYDSSGRSSDSSGRSSGDSCHGPGGSGSSPSSPGTPIYSYGGATSAGRGTPISLMRVPRTTSATIADSYRQLYLQEPYSYPGMASRLAPKSDTRIPRLDLKAACGPSGGPSSAGCQLVAQISKEMYGCQGILFCSSAGRQCSATGYIPASSGDGAPWLTEGYVRMRRAVALERLFLVLRLLQTRSSQGGGWTTLKDNLHYQRDVEVKERLDDIIERRQAELREWENKEKEWEQKEQEWRDKEKERELKEKERAAVCQRREGQLREELAAAELSLQGFQKELANCQNELQTNRMKLLSQQEELSAEVDTLSQTRGELSQTREELSQTREELSQAREELHHTQETLKGTEQTLKGTEQTLKGTQETLKGTQETLKGTNEALKGVQENFEKTKTELCGLKEHYKFLDEECARVKNTLAHKVRTETSLRSELGRLKEKNAAFQMAQSRDRKQDGKQDQGQDRGQVSRDPRQDQEADQVALQRGFKAELHRCVRENSKALLSLRGRMLVLRRTLRLKNFCMSVWLRALYKSDRNLLASRLRVREVCETLRHTRQTLLTTQIRLEQATRESQDLKAAIWSIWSNETNANDRKMKRLMKGLSRIIASNSTGPRAGSTPGAVCSFAVGQKFQSHHLLEAILNNYRHQTVAVTT